MKIKTLIGLGVILMITCLLVLRPVPIVFEEEAITEIGVLEKIYEGGEKDVVLILKNNKRRFYINRGLENGLSLDELKTKFLEKEVIVKYPKYWTPLDWNNSIKHISKLQWKEEIIFDEFKK